jgi:proteasome lid subunit RPN8/RPN11
MLRRFVSVACRWLQNGSETLQDLLRDRLPPRELFSAAGPRSYGPLEQVVLSEEVCRTLFDDYASHRRSSRGEEEIGWVLLGVREETEVHVLATLPAGADREAGVAHVRFNSEAQALASRIVRQSDRRLGIVGVVHTHPGSLRHPSDGDYQGDILWVGQLRGAAGVFGIGTADHAGDGQAAAAAAHTLVEAPLCFSWYRLGAGDDRYQRLPVVVRPGPDLARPLHAVWSLVETHAEPLDGLCRQMARSSFEVLPQNGSSVLAFKIPLLEADTSLQVHLRADQVRFLLQRQGDLVGIDPQEPELERAVYLILAELAREKQRLRAPGSARAGR